jgi:hypothetical protein
MTSQTQVIIDWIKSLGWDTTQELGFPLFAGPWVLTSPDRSVWITLFGGLGYMTEEGSADAWTFQARVRGTANDQNGAETAAQLLDSMIFGASYPASIDGISILVAHRLGSPPAPLPVDPSDQRFEYTCDYVIVTGPGD